MQLREWQHQAMAVYGRLAAQGKESLLLEATPGAGKTTVAGQIILHQLRQVGRKRFAVVVPTAHLRGQWARAMAAIGLRVCADFRAGNGWPKRHQGVALTYQQVAARPGYFADLCRGEMVVLDEVHHAGEGLAWGNALRAAFGDVSFRLLLSGTPFRSDDAPIPFVQYANDESQPDFVYGYAQAIAEGICRPVAFVTYGGQVAWEENSLKWTADFSTQFDPLAARRLRVALAPESDWIRPILADAHHMLCQVRGQHPGAGGLVVAVDREHARKLAAVLRDVTGDVPTVAVSDDQESSRHIQRFTADSSTWLVAVRMVSEGVDIPRLRVGVFATTITTRTYFRQFLGRFTRITPRPAGVQVAYCFMPADTRLEYLAAEIEEEQRHIIAPPVAESVDVAQEPEGTPVRVLWKPLPSQNPGAEGLIVNGRQLTLFGVPAPKWEQVVQAHIETRLAEPPDESRTDLVQQIKRLVGVYCRRYETTYEAVYALLNRTQGVKTQADCSLQQLQFRLSWLRRFG